MNASSQFQDFLDTTSIVVNPDDLESYKGHQNRLRLLGAVAGLLGLSFLIFAAANDFTMAVLTFALSIAMATAYLVRKQSYNAKMMGLLMRQCDPLHFVSAYSAAALSSTSLAKRPGVFYNIALGLVYAGMFSDAHKAAQRMTELSSKPKFAVLAESLEAMMAYYRQDAEGLDQHLEAMKAAKGSSKLAGATNSVYETCMRYPELLGAELTRNYARAYEMLRATTSQGNTVLDDVQSSYNLARISMARHDNAAAKSYRAFVVEHGGTTFFKSRLASSNDKKKGRKERPEAIE